MALKRTAKTGKQPLRKKQDQKGSDDATSEASYDREGRESPTLKEVRAATSSIKDSMARVVIEEERAERF